MQQIKHPDWFYGESEDQDKSTWDDIAEEDMQTIHFYMVENRDPWWTKDRLIALAMGISALLLIIGLCCIPSSPSYSIQTLRLPARFTSLDVQTTVSIHPTGKQVYPAARATGILTIYNGSLLSQQLPAHFLVTTSSGLAIATNQAVVVPGANLPSVGIATVPAYAVLSGSQGNIPPGAIQVTYGASLKISDLSAFTSGQDAYTKTIVTAQDQATALTTARTILTTKQPQGLQSHPCRENASQQALHMIVSWFCQYASYHAPKGVQVLSVTLSGTSVLLVVKMVAHPVTTHFVK